jgi:hypothetical protein
MGADHAPPPPPPLDSERVQPRNDRSSVGNCRAGACGRRADRRDRRDLQGCTSAAAAEGADAGAASAAAGALRDLGEPRSRGIS